MFDVWLKNLNLITVSVQNQDRVRKCGGLDTLVKLLKRLLTNLDTDPGCKTTTIHLLNTLDSCITDNGGLRNLLAHLSRRLRGELLVYQ